MPDWWVGYVLRIREWSVQALLWAVLAVAVSTALRIVLAEFGATLYFATFFPSILVVAVFAGTPAAILATVLTAIIVWWTFIPPQFEFGPLRPSDVANFATFLLSAGSMILLAHVFRKTLAALLKSEQARELLIGELNHRSGNSLAIMQAMINGTVTSEADKQKVIDRIQALARANDLVSKALTGNLPLSALILSEAEPYALPQRLQLDGPEVQLSSETARSVALVLHELMTNAVKYGALSNERGKLQISWSCGEGKCTLRWIEVDGPAVVSPTRVGFGSRMMKASLAQIDGRMEPEFRSSGYSCVLVFATGST